MSKHHKSSIQVNGKDRDSSLTEPCSSLGTSKPFLHSGSNRKELKLSWKKPQTGKSKGATSLTTGSKKRNAWIASSFGDFDESIAKKTKQVNLDHSLKKGASQAVTQKLRKDEDLWLDKYKPKSESELAVHKKKVAEVRNWLLDHLCKQLPSGAILLLTGSAGAGKTATVHVLANELGFEVQEWINPLSDTEGEGEYSNWNSSSQSQIRQFQDFILRVSKYPTLSIFNEKGSDGVKKIILVEDLPNIFFRDSTKLHEVLSTYQQKGRVPVVFIISDSHHGDSNVHKLLPKDVQHKLHIHNISFNPVAHTSLVKAMNRITSLEAQQIKSTFMNPSKETVELLAQNSGGDIRTAINGLQFSCLKDKSYTSRKKFNVSIKDESKPKRSKSRTTKGDKLSNSVRDSAEASQSSQMSQCLIYKKETDSNLLSETVTAIGGRDTALFLFRALGKILYCKRDPALSDVDLLPSHLSHYARNQLLFSPEEVLERSHLSSEVFNLYLHQNYLDFFADIDDVVNISEHFSDADYMTKEWMHQSSMRVYSSCLAARGLIFNGRPGGNSANSSSVGRGWRPLHKPQWFDVNKKMRDGACTARDLFRGCHWPSLVLQTEILPYLAITDAPLRTPGQISFLQVIGSFSKSKSPFRGAPDTLDEKDCGTGSDDDDDDDILYSSQPKGTLTQGTTKCVAEDCNSQVTPEVPQELDDIIEDFDDED